MRQVLEESTRKILEELSEFIRDYTDFGLEVWADRLNNHKNDAWDLPSNLLFKQILEMSDATGELIKVGCVHACYPLIRSALDCYLQLAFILVDNEKYKAQLFLYHYNFKRYKKLIKLVDTESKEGFNQKLKNDKVLKGFKLSPEQLGLAKSDLAALESTLSSELNRPFVDLYGEKELSSWYKALGCNTIKNLEEKLDELGLYEILYRDLSEFSHGTDIVHTNMKLISEENWGLFALRDVVNVKHVIDNSILVLEQAISKFLQAKITDFRKFKEKHFSLLKRSQNLRDHNFIFN